MILAGLTCGNPIFNSLFEDSTLQDTSARGKDVILKVDALKEIISDHSERITTPVFIGIRTGYLQNQHEVRQLDGTEIKGVKIIVTTPRTAAQLMCATLPSAVKQQVAAS